MHQSGLPETMPWILSRPHDGTHETRFDLFEGLLSEAAPFHGDEPLGGGPEDNRLLASPAMRIRMPDLVDLEKGVFLFQQLDYSFVGLEHKLPLEFRLQGRELNFPWSSTGAYISRPYLSPA